MVALAQERQAEKVEGAEVATAVLLVEAVVTPICRADVEVAEAVTVVEGVASNQAVRSPLPERINLTSPKTITTSRRKMQSSRK